MVEHWLEGLIGIWLLLSPWLLGYANLSLAKWSSVIAGIVLVLMSAWSTFGKEKGQ